MISRTLNILNLLANKSSGLLLGPRGVGKTQLSKEWLLKQEYFLSYNLLNSEDFRKLLDNPSILINEVKTKLTTIPKNKNLVLSVLIDEVQKIPELLDICHLLIEDYKGQLRFLLTGSSARKLKSKGANLLAGRAYNLQLHPLTLDELRNSNHQIDLVSILKIGTIPGIIFEENPVLSLRAYVETYLREEIQQEAIVRKLDKFFRFIDLAAQLNGEPINFRKFARQLSIADKTVADYFQILVDTLLVLQLPGWDRSIKKQVLKSPKFYFFDPGVLNAAAGELNLSLSKGSPRFGRLFELFMINEFKRINNYHQLDYSLSYYSTGQMEVDLILSRGKENPLAIEIKSSENISKEELHGLEVFSNEYPKAKLYCVSTIDKLQTVILSNKKEVLVVPYMEATKVILETN